MARAVCLVLAVALTSSACGAATDDAQAIDIAASTPIPTPTPVATTPPLEVPTPTVAPLAASAASSPADTPTPTPTATSEAVPTVPAATATPVPEPTAAPEPTATPVPEPTGSTAPTATAVPAPTASAEPTATAESTTEPTTTAEPSAPIERTVTNLGYVTLGLVGTIEIKIPAAVVELIGFHEASHPGSQAINAAGSGLSGMILESRGRGTPSTSAADIVIPIGEQVRAPVTGTVVASTTYVLYCDHTDQLVYIEPDGLPGWQVRVFHVVGDLPAVGTRVVAGETKIGDGPRQLPFESQIDEFTAEPSWPHVHVEVVDTNVPDTRPPGGGC